MCAHPGGRADYVVGRPSRAYDAHAHPPVREPGADRWVRWLARSWDHRRPERLPRPVAARRRHAEITHDFNYAQVLTLDL